MITKGPQKSGGQESVLVTKKSNAQPAIVEAQSQPVISEFKAGRMAWQVLLPLLAPQGMLSDGALSHQNIVRLDFQAKSLADSKDYCEASLSSEGGTFIRRKAMGKLEA